MVAWATRGGARAIGRDHDLGRLEHGYKADVVLIKNDRSPVSFPLLDPYGHIVLQAQRGATTSALCLPRSRPSSHSAGHDRLDPRVDPQLIRPAGESTDRRQQLPADWPRHLRLQQVQRSTPWTSTSPRCYANTSTRTIFLSLPCAQALRAARLLSEIGDCRARFPAPESLASLAGETPSTRQPGKMKTPKAPGN